MLQGHPALWEPLPLSPACPNGPVGTVVDDEIAVILHDEGVRRRPTPYTAERGWARGRIQYEIAVRLHRQRVARSADPGGDGVPDWLLLRVDHEVSVVLHDRLVFPVE